MGFKHVTSSPYHPQANGVAEKSVQIIKHLLEKAKRSIHQPPGISVDNLGSLAQLLNRCLNSILPTNPAQLSPKVVDPTIVTTHLRKNQETNKHYYERGTKEQLL